MPSHHQPSTKELTQQLTMAGKHHNTHEIERIYWQLVNSGQANVVTFNSMITAAGNNGRMDLAIDAYNRTLRTGQADVVTFSSMITAAGNNGRMDLAIDAYNRVTDQSNYQADEVTHSAMQQARQKNTFGEGPHVPCRQNRPYSYDGTAVFFAPRARFQQINRPTNAATPQV